MQSTSRRCPTRRGSRPYALLEALGLTVVEADLHGFEAAIADNAPFVIVDASLTQRRRERVIRDLLGRVGDIEHLHCDNSRRLIV